MLSQLFGTVWCITVPLAMHGLNLAQKASYPLLCNTLWVDSSALHANIEFNVGGLFERDLNMYISPGQQCP